MNSKRIAANYAVTRRQRRFIARRKMEEEGKEHCCKHSYIGRTGRFSFYTRQPSYFSEHWREYAEAN